VRGSARNLFQNTDRTSENNFYVETIKRKTKKVGSVFEILKLSSI
jgi:hypothetical protein